MPSTFHTDTKNKRVSHKYVLKWTKWIASKLPGCPIWKAILDILIQLTSYIANFMYQAIKEIHISLKNTIILNEEYCIIKIPHKDRYPYSQVLE